MLEAYERAAKQKRTHKEVINYDMDLVNNIISILWKLYYQNYKMGNYREFTIYEPKKRIIQALPFRDRVVQQWYVEEFIKPIFVPQFIEDSYACIDGRGVHKAVKKLNRYLYNYSRTNKDLYILKCDISKFFNNIDKQILYDLVKRKIKDKAFLNLTRQLIFYDNVKSGIPIGNYTSQYFANIYLNELDHYIKEVLKIKYYVRYMDDFVLLLKNKTEAKMTLEKITLFLEQKLKLKLNKKTNYFKLKQGVNFCGYKIYKDHILLKKENKKKIYRKVKKWNELYFNKELDFKNTSLKLNSWVGHAQNADAFCLINKIKKECKWIYDEKYVNGVEAWIEKM